MTLTTPNCPVADSLPKMVKNNIIQIEEVEDVELKTCLGSRHGLKIRCLRPQKLELNL